MTPNLKGKVGAKSVTSEQKRKIPERKEKCDICGRMLLNIKGLDLHKKRMHGTKVKTLIKTTSIFRSDSVRSSKSQQSVKSPPPKKQDTKAEEIPLPETDWIDMDEEDVEMEQIKETKKVSATTEEYMELQEDLKLARKESSELKINITKMREINKTQNENHANTIKKLEALHLKAIKSFGEEFNKALNENAKLQNERDLLIAREEVLKSFDDLAEEEDKEEEQEECIMDGKCSGDCAHIVAENLKNLKAMRNMKHQGGKRTSPVENAEVRVIHRCTQCNSTFPNEPDLRQHLKESHTKYPNCPFCHVSFVNHQVLRNHIDQYHKERTLQIINNSNSAVTSTSKSTPKITRPERTRGQCAFFLQPRGCKKGADCDFSQDQNQKICVIKICKFCQNGPSCSWKPGCKYVHPEEGEVIPPRMQSEREQGFVMPDLTKPPPGYNLASSNDFPVLQRSSVIQLTL